MGKKLKLVNDEVKWDIWSQASANMGCTVSDNARTQVWYTIREEADTIVGPTLWQHMVLKSRSFNGRGIL